MKKITYLVNDGYIINILHCSLIKDEDKELTVIINNELEKKINKSNIITAIDID